MAHIFCVLISFSSGAIQRPIFLSDDLEMLSVTSLLFITMASSMVMILTLLSLHGGNVRGVRQWTLANLSAVCGLVLYAGRNQLPDFITIDLANAFYLSAGAILFAGFSRHLSLRIPEIFLVAGIVLAQACILVFHYGIDSVALRTVVVSAFHGSMCIAIGCAVYRRLGTAYSRYAHLFTVVSASTLAGLHAIRAAVYLGLSSQSVNYLELSTHNLVFLSIGTLALPTLTLGAVMMANAEIIHRAVYAAEHDFLTGAWSRRAFFSLADREHALAIRKGESLSLLIFDIDHFKRINDVYGHAAGDQVLIDIVRATIASIRNADVCARMGGEEFAVLLPGTDKQAARTIGERLRSSLERTVTIEPTKIQLAYTVSLGIATLQENETIFSLLGRADTALYAAKFKGRNTVEFAAAANISTACDSNRIKPEIFSALRP